MRALRGKRDASAAVIALRTSVAPDDVGRAPSGALGELGRAPSGALFGEGSVPDGEESAGTGWRGRLALRFAARAGSTVLVDNRHEGPLLVQRPFYPEGAEVCHAYLVHPPGGLVQGDRLALEATVEPGAHALLTTPGATRFYRCDAGEALLTQHIAVADGGVMEWMPQETIVFDGARATAETRVALASGARFFGWEVLCLGRPAANERFESGHLLQRIEVWRGGEPLLWERSRFAGGSEALAARWGLAGYPVVATAVAVADAPIPVQPLREALPPAPADGEGALTSIEGLLVARCLARNAEAARHWLTALWTAVRPQWAGRPAIAPRIWLT